MTSLPRYFSLVADDSDEFTVIRGRSQRELIHPLAGFRVQRRRLLRIEEAKRRAWCLDWRVF